MLEVGISPVSSVVKANMKRFSELWLYPLCMPILCLCHEEVHCLSGWLPASDVVFKHLFIISWSLVQGTFLILFLVLYFLFTFSSPCSRGVSVLPMQTSFPLLKRFCSLFQRLCRCTSYYPEFTWEPASFLSLSLPPHCHHGTVIQWQCNHFSILRAGGVWWCPHISLEMCKLIFHTASKLHGFLKHNQLYRSITPSLRMALVCVHKH